MAESNPSNANSALAASGPTMTRAKLEDMMISLGVAETQKEVWELVNSIDGHTPGDEELNFDDYLEIVRAKLNSKAKMQVWQAMMKGTLGNPNLNFETVLSEYRRGMIINATGAPKLDSQPQTLDETPSSLGATGGTNSVLSMSRFSERSVRREPPDDKDRRKKQEGLRILGNFATLQKGRHAEAPQQHRVSTSSRDGRRRSDVSQVSSHVSCRERDLSEPPSFQQVSGQAPLGKLEWLWNSVVADYRIKSSRPNSADGERSPTFGRPPSPSEVIMGIAKTRPKIDKRTTGFGPTKVVFEPFYSSTGRASPQSPQSPARSLGGMV